MVEKNNKGNIKNSIRPPAQVGGERLTKTDMKRIKELFASKNRQSLLAGAYVTPTADGRIRVFESNGLMAKSFFTDKMRSGMQAGNKDVNAVDDHNKA